MADIDMSPEAIGARLRRVAELRRPRTLVDMSPEAVSRRLRRVSELRTLCKKLGQFSPPG